MNQKKKISKKIIIIVIILIIIIGLLVFLLPNFLNNKTSTESSSNSSKITSGGKYEITGNNECIVINTKEEVELDLTDATISCSNGPAINVKAAENVKIVLTGDNKIEAKTTESLDGAIYSKDDLELEGDGTLTITSNYDGIVSKDDLNINSGTYTITADDDGIRGKDSVEISESTITIKAGGDGVKATNEEEEEKGYVIVKGGKLDIESQNDGIAAITTLALEEADITIKTTSTNEEDSRKGLKSDTNIEITGGKYNITSTDDAIHSNGNITLNSGEFTIESDDDALHADGLIEIKDGTYSIKAHEGIEGTYVKIGGGTITIDASDDGINAANKSDQYTPTVEINGGEITINMGQGDTDGIDSNGNLYLNGGTIKINAQSPFDYDGEAKLNGATLIINGTETTTITNQMMGGMGGQAPGQQGQQPTDRAQGGYGGPGGRR